MQFQNPSLDIVTFAILLAILCLFAIMLRRRRRRPTLLERPKRDVAYEWLAEPLLKATKDLRSKFSGLDDLPQADDVQLIRLGIFNLGTSHSKSFNDMARMVIKWHGKGSIDYVPFPENLKGVYQNFTEADITALREAGYSEAFRPIKDGVNEYLHYLNGNSQLVEVQELKK